MSYDTQIQALADKDLVKKIELSVTKATMDVTRASSVAARRFSKNVSDVIPLDIIRRVVIQLDLQNRLPEPTDAHIDIAVRAFISE